MSPKTPHSIKLYTISHFKTILLINLPPIILLLHISGDNLCTRCPSIVQTVVDRSLANGKVKVMVATDAHYKKNLIVCNNLNSVCAAIEKTTDILTNNVKTVVHDPIYIRVCRNNGHTLTIMDIPGITSLSSAQDDIEEVTTSMTRKHIMNENMVVLVVIPASEDFHNPKALKLAKEEDPYGERTIGVLFYNIYLFFSLKFFFFNSFILFIFLLSTNSFTLFCYYYICIYSFAKL